MRAVPVFIGLTRHRETQLTQISTACFRQIVVSSQVVTR